MRANGESELTAEQIAELFPANAHEMEGGVGDDYVPDPSSSSTSTDDENDAAAPGEAAKGTYIHSRFPLITRTELPLASRGPKPPKPRPDIGHTQASSVPYRPVSDLQRMEAEQRAVQRRAYEEQLRKRKELKASLAKKLLHEAQMQSQGINSSTAAATDLGSLARQAFMKLAAGAFDAKTGRTPFGLPPMPSATAFSKPPHVPHAAAKRLNDMQWVPASQPGQQYTTTAATAPVVARPCSSSTYAAIHGSHVRTEACQRTCATSHSSSRAHSVMDPKCATPKSTRP